MAKNKYSVTDPSGNVHTRSTNRTYVATVLVKHSLLASIAEIEKGTWPKYEWDINADYYEAVANGTSPYSQTADQIQAAKDRIALGRDGWVAKKVAVQRERLIKDVTPILGADGDTYYLNAGWCGRMDLAQKLAAKEGGIVFPVA